MKMFWTRGRQLATLTLVCLAWPGLSHAADTWDQTIVQYGSMHEAVGKRLHHGRVQLQTLLESEHLYAVGALEKLGGEFTVTDGHVIVTRVGADKQLQSEPHASKKEAQATMLVGAYVPSWNEHSIPQDLTPDEVEAFILERADAAGINTEQPFPFLVAGELTDLRLHVIHGACPMHARLNKLELPEQLQPVEINRDRVRGTLVGMFAKDSVGNLTHPATSCHTHVIMEIEPSEKITGHVERVGIATGSILRLPRIEPDPSGSF